MEEHRWLENALQYANTAFEIYNQTYSDTNELTISTLWLLISINYSLKSDNTNNLCDNLFVALNKRDDLMENPKEQAKT